MPRAVIVCQTCRLSAEQKCDGNGVSGGEKLTQLLEAALEGRDDVQIQKQDCLWACSQHCNIILSDTERFSYLVGRFDPGPEVAKAIIEWFDKHGKSTTGQVPFREWPEAIKGHFLARLPVQSLPQNTGDTV